MITHFEWRGPGKYVQELFHYRVVKRYNADRVKAYALFARDKAGHTHVLAEFRTDGPLTNEERDQVIAIGPYHPTLVRVFSHKELLND